MERYVWITVTHLAWLILRFQPVAVHSIGRTVESLYTCRSQCPPGYACVLVRTSPITVSAECSRIPSTVDTPFAWQEDLFARHMLHPQQRHFGNGEVIPDYLLTEDSVTPISGRNGATLTQEVGRTATVGTQQSGHTAVTQQPVRSDSVNIQHGNSVTKQSRQNEEEVAVQSGRTDDVATKHSGQNNSAVAQQSGRNDSTVIQLSERIDVVVTKHSRRNDSAVTKQPGRKLGRSETQDTKQSGNTNGTVIQQSIPSDDVATQQSARTDGVVNKHSKRNDGVVTQQSGRNDAEVTRQPEQTDVVVFQRKDDEAIQQIERNDSSVAHQSGSEEYLDNTRIGIAIRHMFNKIRRRDGLRLVPLSMDSKELTSIPDTDASMTRNNNTGFEDPMCASCEPDIGCGPGLYCYYSPECSKQICQPLVL